VKWIAALLLLGVFARHSAHTWLAEGSRIAAAGWVYILGGVWEIALCAVLWAIFAPMRRTVWTRLAVSAMVIGICEGLQLSACRLAVTDLAAVPRGMNLCDHVSGMPIGAVSFSLYLIIVCWSIVRKQE